VTDFFTFWLAGRMTIQGQDVYSETLWTAGHHYYGSTWMPNPIFPYPIPLSVMLVPLGLLSLKSAYTLWVFITQGVLAFSVFLLTESWEGEEREALRYILIVSMFLFRPVLITLITAQLVGLFLFVSSLAVYFWKKEKWFLGGLVISLLNLKPSYGALLLALLGIWLLSQKQGRAILAIILGNLALGIIGFIQNPQWIQLFIETGRRKASQTFGLNPTIWGVANVICNGNSSCVAALSGMTLLFLMGLYIHLVYSNRNSRLDPLGVLALAIPIALLTTPYNWAYDQILLIVTIVFCVQEMARGHKYLPRIFPFLLDLICLLLLVWAYFYGMDVWSLLVPAGLFGMAVWFWGASLKKNYKGILNDQLA
jgi:hypothetical protein